MLISFTEADIRRIMPNDCFKQGFTYWLQGNVFELRAQSLQNGAYLIAAEVRGAKRARYTVNIAVSINANGQIHFDSNCSCQSGCHCEHAVAALFSALEQGKQLDSQIESPIFQDIFPGELIKPTSPNLGNIPTTTCSAPSSTTANFDYSLNRWLERLSQVTLKTDNSNVYPSHIRQRILYLFNLEQKAGEWYLQVEAVSTRLKKNGRYGKVSPLRTTTADYVLPKDQSLFKELENSKIHHPSGFLYNLRDAEAVKIFQHLLATGRCHWKEKDNPSLSLGSVRIAGPLWKMSEEGTQHFTYDVEGNVDAFLPFCPPWYVDNKQGLCGPLQTGLPDPLAAALLEAPPLKPAQVEVVRQTLTERIPNLPQPRSFQQLRHKPVQPTIHLYLYNQIFQIAPFYRWKYNQPEIKIPMARLSFLYEGISVNAYAQITPTLIYFDNKLNELVQIERQLNFEKPAKSQLKKLGFAILQGHHLHRHLEIPEANRNDIFLAVGTNDEVIKSALFNFSWYEIPKLRAQGWQVEMDKDYSFRVIEPELIEEWYAKVEEGNNIDWFSLELGVTIAGKRIKLLPLLVNLLQGLSKGDGLTQLMQLPDETLLTPRLEDGRILPLPMGRVQNIISILIELLDKQPLDAEGRLHLRTPRATQLVEIETAMGTEQLRWLGDQRWLELGRKIKNFQGIESVPIPDNFQTSLRPYQQEGLSWLQFLREYGLGGILGDDMGLGKAQPLDAKILTPWGWKLMKDIQVGDQVINAQGLPSQVKGVYPQGEKMIYKVTLSDGATTECCEEHLWSVIPTYTNAKSIVLTTQQLIQRKIVALWKKGEGTQKHYKFKIPIVKPVEFKVKNKFTIHPYLLGTLIGNQCLGLKNSIELICQHDEIATICNQYLKNEYFFKQEGLKNRYRLVKKQGWKNEYITFLQELKLWNLREEEKFIPEKYQQASIEARIHLISGLLDSQGKIHSASNQIIFTTHSKQLAQDIQFIVQSLGGIGLIKSPNDDSSTESNEYVVYINIPNIIPFKLTKKSNQYKRNSSVKEITRKIIDIEPIGIKPAQCIAVDSPDNLYVTDDFIVTHNTVQTLAHLLTEKNHGRLTQPSLIIAPTSLMDNWRQEAERFAPDLKVLTLHGSIRKKWFEEIGTHDLILTTYSLLHRDQDALLQYQYHLLVLDEAQNIKNPNAQATRIVHQLKAHHRLCLTGTPIENHLGELWSLSHFIMPGLLGDYQSFRRLFRIPIEKENDTSRRTILTRRLKPFLLRRTKEAVIDDLPEKNEIIRLVKLEDSQRDLYETIRLTMHDKIRQEIARKGFARSQIIILDALLKLRQVCCDPRLLKLEAAQQVKQSAKLQLLMEMIPEMIEEGRRILLFSQFTTMLSLIEEGFKKSQINYVKLTGQTQKRAQVVESFQKGKVPIFLISLKAGGTGLNLTAADTVIHYDPWWNPAVESQATDRAHRIGQNKHVFVYKLLSVGTVEEKIQKLQVRKRQLTEILFSEKNRNGRRLSNEDLEVLFEPLV